MSKVHKTRKGFSLVEMIVVAIMLAIITIACMLVSNTVSSMRIRARNNILLTTHNLNVMEQLRQEMYNVGEYGKLEIYYGFNDDKAERDVIVAAGLDPDDVTNYRPNYSTYANSLYPNTGDIRTDVYLDISEWDHFHIYSVRIESKVIGYAQQLTNTYVLTDIGIERSPVVAP